MSIASSGRLSRVGVRASRRSALRSAGFGAIGVAFFGAARVSAAASQDVPVDPLYPLRALFDFHVRQGPGAGLHLSGDLKLDVDPAGAISGSWRLVDQSIVQVVGQATGRAVNLMLMLSDGRRVFGVGTADFPLGGGSTIIGGVGTGPNEGDSADWLISSFAAQPVGSEWSAP
jgi:hypothetical protein